MNLGVEFLSSIKINDEIATYTGGTNYAKGVLRALIDRTKNQNVKIVLLMPVGFQPTAEEETLFTANNCTIEYLSDLREYDYSKLDTVFLPQVNGSTLLLIPDIKQKYPNVKIVATLHDRQHNYYKYDWYDRFYYDGVRRLGLSDWITYYLKRIAFCVQYGRCVKNIDKVFTDSNYSMQKLMHSRIKNIKFFIQESIFDAYDNEEGSRGDYILMVGGGRPEKNLLRTMIAFCKFKKETGSDTRFVITGVNKKTQENLLNSKMLDEQIITQSVQFLPYLSYQELANVYSNCKYVVFTSKGEGYGLPVREAMYHGKTVLASRTTSVPEVAGAALYYVDPFDVNSICEGFKFLDKEANLEKYEGYVSERNAIIHQLAKMDTEIVIDEILT